MPHVTVKFDDKGLKMAFDSMRKSLSERGIVRMNSLLGEETRNIIVRKYLSGRVQDPGLGLNRKTGTLAKSINWELVGKTRVAIGTNVPYGSIHEFGATVRRKSRKSASEHGRGKGSTTVKYPKRAFMAPGISDLFTSGKALEIMTRVFNEEAKRNWK